MCDTACLPIIQQNGTLCVLQRQSQYCQLACSKVYIQPLRRKGSRLSHRDPFVALRIGDVIASPHSLGQLISHGPGNPHFLAQLG